MLELEVAGRERWRKVDLAVHEWKLLLALAVVALLVDGLVRDLMLPNEERISALLHVVIHLRNCILKFFQGMQVLLLRDDLLL